MCGGGFASALAQKRVIDGVCSGVVGFPPRGFGIQKSPERRYHPRFPPSHGYLPSWQSYVLLFFTGLEQSLSSNVSSFSGLVLDTESWSRALFMKRFAGPDDTYTKALVSTSQQIIALCVG